MIVATSKKPPRLQNRRTPRWLFDALNALFGPFVLDAFADQRNTLCPRFYTKAQDGTRRPWGDVTFFNPPFAIMGDAVAQAVHEAEAGRARSIGLAPVGCSQDWYHELAIRGTVYVPDFRFNYDTPSGRPTKRADRDSIVLALGGEHENPDWRKGVFRVRRLTIDVR